MANKKCRALSIEEYHSIIKTISEGYYDDRKCKPNPRVAFALILEAQLGIRISDVLKIKLDNIILDGERYRLEMVEKKTGKQRTFTVPEKAYTFICDYCLSNNIGKHDIIIPLTERAIQHDIQRVVSYLDIKGNISSHSFRKMYATEIYKQSNYDIALVTKLLNHSSSAITQRYIGISEKKIEDVLNSYVVI
jgi:integrase